MAMHTLSNSQVLSSDYVPATRATPRIESVEVVALRCLGFQFNFDYRVTGLTVLWALGWSMIALSALVHLPTKLVAAIGVALIVGHNAFDGIRSTNPMWVMLHQPGFLLRTPEHVAFVAYPLIPWIGVTAVGFALG